jgi:hypothetical protein
MDSRRGFVIQGLMEAVLIVEDKVVLETVVGLSESRIVFEINLHPAGS